MSRRVFAKAALALGVAAALVGLVACGQDKPAFRGVDITGADYAQGFELSDQNGQVRTLKDFAGKAVVVFFGYTQCPDVCPTALQEMAQAKQLLGADADKLQGVFITVDPARHQGLFTFAMMASRRLGCMLCSALSARCDTTTSFIPSPPPIAISIRQNIAQPLVLIGLRQKATGAVSTLLAI